MESNRVITEGRSESIKYVITYVFEEEKRDTSSNPTEKAIYMKTRNMVQYSIAYSTQWWERVKCVQ